MRECVVARRVPRFQSRPRRHHAGRLGADAEHTKPLDAVELAKLYPTQDTFVRKFNTAVESIVRAGYWLKPEADLARAAARQAPIGK